MINVQKADGSKEPFNQEKLKFSIQRAGVPQDLQNKALEHIKSILYENIPTSSVYDHLAEFLGQSDMPYTKAKYSLKRGIMDFGPTGYPFEDYIDELLKSNGYKTTIRSVLVGKCVSHEVDVIAEKDEKKFMIEAKFHNNPGTKSNVHVSLYTKSRFDDLKEKHNLDQAWIITNTKITSDALSYAMCSDIKVTSWDYPEEESLRDLIEKFKLHPITVLNTLSYEQKQQLLNNHVVLCKQIVSNPSFLDTLGLPNDKKNSIVSECQFVSEE